MKSCLIIALLSIPALDSLALAGKGPDMETLIAKVRDVVE